MGLNKQTHTARGAAFAHRHHIPSFPQPLPYLSQAQTLYNKIPYLSHISPFCPSSHTTYLPSLSTYANFNTISIRANFVRLFDRNVKMAPRKRAVLRSVKVNDNNYLKNLTLNNVLCPICRNIFIEPVTLPCNHGFCFNCFEGTVANANLTCPLCRVRFGSWHRIAKKDNRIVNLTLWEAVKEAFPDKVKNRLEGIDENLDVGECLFTLLFTSTMFDVTVTGK